MVVSQVALLDWPDDIAERPGLRRAGLACLWLVAGDEAPPDLTDPGEDWIVADADAWEIAERVARLAARAATERAGRVRLSGDGLLWVGEAWVAPTPLEHRLLGPLVERLGELVGRALVVEAGWGPGSDGRGLNVALRRLRQRLVPVGLRIDAVAGRGYVLRPARPVRPA